MGAIAQIGAASSQHKIEQSKVDAARIVQKANNAAQISIADSKKIVQSANNSYAAVDAANRRRLQAINNGMAAEAATGQRSLQATYNANAEEIATARKTLQAARNERAGMDSDVARWGASVANARVMKMAGERINAVTQEVAQGLDLASQGRLSDRVAFSEMLGSSVANAAAAGVGGSSIEQYNQSMHLRQALKEEAEDRVLNTKQYQAVQQRSFLLQDANDKQSNLMGFVPDMDREAIVAQKDLNPIYDQQDYSMIVEDHDYGVYSPDLDYTYYADAPKMSLGQKLVGLASAGAQIFSMASGAGLLGGGAAAAATKAGSSLGTISAFKPGLSFSSYTLK